ncbi:MAG: hypothetical protein Kow009_04670 [Spirochaetales bacterium]
MKKLWILIILAGLVLPVFADDALVLPQGVLRLSLAPSYGFASEKWDKDGDAQDITIGVGTKSDGVQYFNLGIALEYGVTDWITAALQWTPGWNIWSTMGFDKQLIAPNTYLYFDQGVLGSFADLFAGAKIQIIGKKAPVANEAMRFSVAPGVKIPMPGASAADKKPTEDEAFVAKEPDNHLWGMGARLYFDYNVTPEFFVNLYSEFIYYPEQKVSDSVNFGDDVKVAKGYDWTIEVEPQYWAPVADGMIFKAFLPFTYKMTPDYKIDGTKQTDKASTILTMTPALGLFFTKTFMPIELEVGYRWPLMGTNNTVMNVVYVLGRFYMKF